MLIFIQPVWIFKLFRTANKDMNVAPSVTFPCQPKCQRQKATTFVRNLNATRVCWGISISVLAKCFLLMSLSSYCCIFLVKFVRSRHYFLILWLFYDHYFFCLFAVCIFLYVFLLPFVVNKDVHKFTRTPFQTTLWCCTVSICVLMTLSLQKVNKDEYKKKRY